ncbi:hypothetical protein EDC54_10331 [Samsonia erythrinae]|uniref:Uncharacterized protein n=1 Tax=Samsonia erythrinae TaxID=160434 RepID=A0A4R3VQD6_9GAMM|nr:hypothetical protein EDC54_10331 [Samsonia erythrinae]
MKIALLTFFGTIIYTNFMRISGFKMAKNRIQRNNDKRDRYNE